MKVKCKDLEVGMVVRFEYGDYDNWVTVKVMEINRLPEKSWDLIYVAPLRDLSLRWDVCIEHNDEVELLSV